MTHNGNLERVMMESGVIKSQGWATNAFANQILLPLVQLQHLQFLSMSRCHVVLLNITSNISARNQSQKEGRICFTSTMNCALFWTMERQGSIDLAWTINTLHLN